MKNTKRNALKKVLHILINFIISICIYKLILLLGDRVNVMIYYVGVSCYVITIAVLFCIFYAKNGYSFYYTELKTEDLPDELSDEEKERFIAKREKNKHTAQKLLFVILPMILTVFLNYAELIFSHVLSN